MGEEVIVGESVGEGVVVGDGLGEGVAVGDGLGERVAVGDGLGSGVGLEMANEDGEGKGLDRTVGPAGMAATWLRTTGPTALPPGPGEGLGEATSCDHGSRATIQRSPATSAKSATRPLANSQPGSRLTLRRCAGDPTEVDSAVPFPLRAASY